METPVMFLYQRKSNRKQILFEFIKLLNDAYSLVIKYTTYFQR